MLCRLCAFVGVCGRFMAFNSISPTFINVVFQSDNLLIKYSILSITLSSHVSNFMSFYASGL
jgi:hypothetical protein